MIYSMSKNDKCFVYCSTGSRDDEGNNLFQWKRGTITEVYDNGRMDVSADDGRVYNDCSSAFVKSI